MERDEDLKEDKYYMNNFTLTFEKKEFNNVSLNRGHRRSQNESRC